MDQREACLVADGVIAPDFRDVHGVLGGQAARHVHAAGRYVEMERRTRPSEMRPLRHRFEMIDRFCRLDFDRAHELSAAIGRRQDQVGEYLNLADSNGHRLVFADIGRDIVPPLETYLKEPDHPVVLELLAYGSHQYGAHLTSRRDGTPNQVFLKNNGFYSRGHPNV